MTWRKTRWQTKRKRGKKNTYNLCFIAVTSLSTPNQDKEMQPKEVASILVCWGDTYVEGTWECGRRWEFGPHPRCHDPREAWRYQSCFTWLVGDGGAGSTVSSRAQNPRLRSKGSSYSYWSTHSTTYSLSAVWGKRKEGREHVFGLYVCVWPCRVKEEVVF